MRDGTPERSASDAPKVVASLPPPPTPDEDWTDETILTRRPPPPADDAPPSSLAIPVDVDLAPPSAESAGTEDEKPRDSVPVLTSSEADDIDIDALLADEDAVVPTTFATQPPANPDEPEVPATDEPQKKAALPPLPAVRPRTPKRRW